MMSRIRASKVAPIAKALSRLAAIDAVGDVTDGGSEVVRVIPPFDGTEIVVDEQRRAAVAIGQNQRGFRLATAERGATGRPDAEPGPIGDRTPALEPGESRVEIAR